MSEVRCPHCLRVNPTSNSFCVGCGVRLPGVDSPVSEGADQTNAEEEQQVFRAELASVRNQLRDVGLLLDRLQNRISQLELGQAAPSQESQPHQEVGPLVPEQAVARRPQAQPVGEAQEHPASFEVLTSPASFNPTLDPVEASPRAGQAPPELPPVPGAGGWGISGDPRPFGLTIDWEHVLGRNWFAIIGVVSLVLGIGFFLKLAFDNDWIGDTGRVVVGILLGMVLLGVGEFTQRRFPLWSQPVTAGGAAILYLSIYAAFGLYALIRPDVALLFLGLVITTAGLLALRYESIIIAVLGIIGAFLAPVLLGPDLPDVRLLLIYILVVDLGILGVSTFRNWRWFNLLGWVGSYGLFAYWLDHFPGYGPLLVQAALTGVFLIFAGATTLFHLLWKRVPGPLDMGLMAINGTGFFALTVTILWEDHEIWFGLISLGMSLFYGLIAFAAIKRSGAPSQFPLVALPMALVFLTIAVPLQLSGIWVTVAWATQGAVLVWAGFLLNRWQMRAFGLGVLALAVGHLLLFDAWVDLEEFSPVLNQRFPVFLVVIVAFYVAGVVYWRNRHLSETWEHATVPVLLIVANLLTLGLFSLEIVGYFGNKAVQADRFLDDRNAENGMLLTLTAVWGIYGFIVLAVGLAFQLRLARWGGLVLMGLVVLKFLAYDTFRVQLESVTFVAFLNPQFLTSVIIMVLLLGAAYWSWRESSNLPEEESLTFEVLLVVANVVALWSLSLEVIHYFDFRESPLAVDSFSAKHLSLTVLWTVYAIAVIGMGIAKRTSKVRLAGMALLAIPVVKLFVFDVFLLEQGYRVAAFVTLGILLLGTGLAYQRYSHAMRGFLFGQRA